MADVRACALPDGALLRRYAVNGAFADCYVTDIAGRVSHADFVEAFYTTPAFKVERWILRLLASRPSTDAQARQLARGESDVFAAWTVEARATGQLLLADVAGRTRSWLMVQVRPDGEGSRLFFGSAVVPRRHTAAGPTRLGFAFKLLLGFHGLYSRTLLRAARLRLGF
jgi:hypothetical protein